MAENPDTLRYAENEEHAQLSGYTLTSSEAHLQSKSHSHDGFPEAELRSELEAVSQHLRGSLETTDAPPKISTLGRYLYMALGGLCVALGTIGVFVPVLPTTVFMIVALWAFSRSSPKLRDWLYTHKHFGPALQNWVTHRSIPARARQFSLASLLISALIIGQMIGGLACLAFILFVCTPVASFLWMLPTSPEA